jgi:hypothetical protein
MILEWIGKVDQPRQCPHGSLVLGRTGSAEPTVDDSNKVETRRSNVTTFGEETGRR